jgi:hypothetical protein
MSMSGIIKKVVKLFFPKPKMPAPTPVTPTVATPAVQAAGDAQRMRQRAASGRAATMLTSTEEQSQTPMTATKKLLGM